MIKQNLALVVISYEIYDTRRITSRVRSSISYKITKNRRAAFGRQAVKLVGEGGDFNYFSVDQPSPIVLLCYLRLLVVRCA